MEAGGNPSGSFDGTYNKLDREEDYGADDHLFYSRHEKQQVSMSMVKPAFRLNHHKLLTVLLAVLAVFLLAVDIGLGVYYRQLTDGQRIVMDISSEVVRLQVSYNKAVQSRDKAKKELEDFINEQKMQKWELEHADKISKSYQTEIGKITSAIASLKSHMPMIEEGCRHCLPGWTFMRSMCYYFAVSDDTMAKSWQASREFCQSKGGDLAVTDTREKHLAVMEYIKQHETQHYFWIGLTDEEEEGNWRWLDARRVIESFWMDGEPNNSGGGEDCAAVYPKVNPFKAWNDIPCRHVLRWICEMAPSLVG